MIALTANAISGAREMYLANGFDDYLSKPFEKMQLHEMLSRWVSEKNYTDEQLNNDEVSEDEVSEIYIDNLQIREVCIKNSLSMDDYLHFLDIFYMDGVRKIKLIDDLKNKKEYSEYKIQVHGLKSAAANIGAFYLSDMAKKLEEAAAAGDEAYINQNHRSMLDSYKRLLTDIKAALKKKHYGSFDEDSQADNAGDESENKPENKQDIDYTSLKGKLTAALNAVEHFKPKETIASLEEMLAGGETGDLTGELKDILGLLKMYEDDMAEDRLRELLKKLDEM
jgi:HPt (histidine-containing phosphotransfer) domain-containing protein